MYRLLIADDERIIREGIRDAYDWASMGFHAPDTASNGVEACELILEEEPDLAIMDIKMPVMNGLQVIERACEQGSRCRFIILSGYGEFEFAKTAMAYGVKHFLLKPCNNQMLREAVQAVLDEIGQDLEARAFLEQARERYRQLIPHVREQFLRDYVTRRITRKEEVLYYRELLQWAVAEAAAALLQPEEPSVETLVVTEQLARRLGEDVLLQSCMIGRRLLLLLRPMGYRDLFQVLRPLRDDARRLEVRLLMAAEETARFRSLPEVYRRMEECFAYSFPFPDGIVTPRDILGENSAPAVPDADYRQLSVAIRSGNLQRAEECFEEILQPFTRQVVRREVVRVHLFQLFTHIVACDAVQETDYMGQIGHGERTVEELVSFVRETARRITLQNSERALQRHSRLITRVIECTEQYLGDERLSLTWLAHELLYVNVDYLGKVIKRELGEKYSTYVYRARMEKAMDILRRSPDMRMLDVAESVGFGANAQYFSLQFKKFTGVTPTDYQRSQGGL